MKRIAILGSTGSIGRSALEVVRNHSESFSIELLVAGQQHLELAQQIRTLRPAIAGLANRAAFTELCRELGVSDGAALEAGKDVALANKESLVVAGALVLEKARQSGARIIPVDSEHSAIFQVLQGARRSELSCLILTASGGPFLHTPLDQFPGITPEQALKHPQWSMGAKVTIDSATMMNKALEVIEARWLFDISSAAIEVVIHPQSIVHSMIRLRDETILAQLSLPDMKGPIAYALRYPEDRLPGIMRPLDLTKIRELTFLPVDDERFPSIKRARACLEGAAGACAVLNAANEVAVHLFLSHRIPFTSIHIIIERALERFGDMGYESLGELMELCATVSEWAQQQAS